MAIHENKCLQWVIIYCSNEKLSEFYTSKLIHCVTVESGLGQKYAFIEKSTIFIQLAIRWAIAVLVRRGSYRLGEVDLDIYN